jgi:hypothetical protein
LASWLSRSTSKPVHAPGEVALRVANGAQSGASTRRCAPERASFWRESLPSCSDPPSADLASAEPVHLRFLSPGEKRVLYSRPHLSVGCCAADPQRSQSAALHTLDELDADPGWDRAGATPGWFRSKRRFVVASKRATRIPPRYPADTHERGACVGAPSGVRGPALPSRASRHAKGAQTTAARAVRRTLSLS